MNSSIEAAHALLTVETNPYRVRIRESCGLHFEPQILEIDVPAEAPALFALREARTGRLFPVQKSNAHATRGFLLIEIGPFDDLQLVPAEDAADITEPVRVNGAVVGNGSLNIELPAVGEETDGLQVSGPVARVRLGGGPWRGRTFFDARSRVAGRRLEWLERGPLRASYGYEVTFEDGGHYRATVTLDAGADFAVVDETFAGAPGDQVVWDFGGADLPRELFLLDSSPGGALRPLQYHGDSRHARLACWTQYQQLHDLSDGFALLYETDLIGFVALEGGRWSGNRLNHLEAWTRRWWRDDARSRREPSAAKSDSMPGPDNVPARGVPQAKPHFCVEGWIGAAAGEDGAVAAGHRRFALVAARRDGLYPGANDTVHGDGLETGHFENRSDRERYRRSQSLLRRLHIQRGLLPLQAQAGWSFAWPDEAVRDAAAPARFGYPHMLLDHSLREHSELEAERIEQMREYLAARVYGFWEGGGSAHCNCVAGRAIAPEMFHFEYLVGGARLAETETPLLRAHFAFLCHLFHSDNYYPGAATMHANGHRDSVEPTLAGMANQNFLTDVVTVGAVGAQVFYGHPQAADWRTRWAEIWRRQLQFHVYPESGVWEESHTYYQHVLSTVLPVILRRRDDGLDDALAGGFADPLFQTMAGALMQQLTPALPPLGRRHQVAFGDHMAVTHGPYAELPRELAQAVEPHNVELARAFAWASREMSELAVPGIESVAPVWRSAPVAGQGFFFRAANEGGESLLALRAGGAWGHHHNDEGSVQFFAYGQQLIVDSAFGHVQPGGRKFAASGHSRWSLRDGAPVNHLWRFNRGGIVGWGSVEGGSRLSYATAFCPVSQVNHELLGPQLLVSSIAAWRTVVQLAPTAFLVVDDSDSALPQVVRFHVPGGEVELRGAGIRAVVGEAALHVLPLKLDVGECPASRVAATDEPADGDGRYRTTEVCFDLPGRRAAFVVAAQSVEELPVVEGQVLSGAGWRVRVEVAADGRLGVTDLVGGGVLEIEARTVPEEFWG